jgi:hypothetical protein
VLNFLDGLLPIIFFLLIFGVVVVAIGIFAAATTVVVHDLRWERKYGREPAVPTSSPVVYSRPKPARQTQQLSEVATFTRAVMRLESNNVLTLTEKLAFIAEEYVKSIDRLAAYGQLTPQVEAEFRSFAEDSARAATGLTANFNNALQYLVKSYPGRRGMFFRRRRIEL